MIKRYVLLLFPIMFFSGLLLGQGQVEFAYDQNGNRISRMLVVVELKSDAIDFPVTTPDSLKADDEKKDESVDKYIKVFPNPVKSTLTIQIIGFDENLKKDAIVFNMAGSKLKQERCLGSQGALELGTLDDGVYILRITVGGEIFQYKIIKSN